MQALLDVILPVFVVVGFGYLLAWWRVFSDAAIDGIVRYTQHFAIPCLLFVAIAGLDLSATIKPALIGSFYLGAFCGFALGYLGARHLLQRSPTDAVAIGFACLFSNSILLGVPITERAFGSEALADNFAIIAFHAPLCYMIGVTAMEVARAGEAPRREKTARVLSAMFRNPFVIGIALGLVANLTEADLPRPVMAGLDLVVASALPAALFGLGGILFRYRPEGDARAIAMVCAISLVVHPAIVWASGTWTGLDRDGMRSAILTASMAPGVNAYIFAHMYGAAPRVAASSVLVATALSILTVWVWLMVLP